ncbi:hypothetical protein BH10ACT11_BH10ACT11_16720 [soil metagenome]
MSALSDSGAQRTARSTSALPSPLPVFAICVSLTFAMTLIVMAVSMLSLPATRLPEPFPEQHQSAENITFLFALLVALPVGIVLGRRFAARIATGPSAAALQGAAVACAGSLAVVLATLRLVRAGAEGDTLVVQTVLAGLWLIIAASGLSRLGLQAGPARSLPLLRHPVTIALAIALLVFAAVSVVDSASVSLAPLLVGLVAVTALDRFGAGAPRLGAKAGHLVDVVVVALIVLAVPNLNVFDPANPFFNTILQFHQNFFIGPAGRVLAGDPALAGNFSQYGVVSIDAVAGWFRIVPANNLTLALLEGLLSALMFMVAYATMRIAGVARAIAIPTMVVALIACDYALIYPLGGLLQHGAIRFGMPAGVVLAAVAATRWPQRRTAWRVFQFLTLGLSSVWALEAFAYTAFTLLAILAVQASIRPRETGLRWFGKQAAVAVGVIAGTHLLFALVMLAATGSLPEWGTYISILRAFLVGRVGDLTYDFEPFSPAFAVGAFYLASIVAIVLLLVRKIDRGPAWEVKLVAVTGATAWGLALFSYFVNRSGGHILPYICLPALMAGALWLAIVIEAFPDRRARERRTGIAVAGALAVLVVSVAFSRAGSCFSDSALALAAPGGRSLTGALKTTWDPPPLSAEAGTGERLLRRYMPGESESLVLTAADPGIEMLTRTDRTNALPFGDPWEESFVPHLYAMDIRRAADGLPAGQRALLDDAALRAFRGFRRNPGRNPIHEPFGRASVAPTGLAPLEQLALKQIGERFDLVPIAKDNGLAVVELRPRA